MKNDNSVQLVVIDTPNILKSFVVGGWYPYTFAYYNNISEAKDYPVVIPYWEDAVRWVCADKILQKKIQTNGGFGSNRDPNEIINKDHIYAWRLNVNGELINRTDQLRGILDNCHSGGTKGRI
jgi:hypothetical protein